MTWWPWMSRSAHEEIAGLLGARVRELEVRERMLWDRLMSQATGDPLFSARPPGAEAETAEQEGVDPHTVEVQKLLRMRRRPSMLADFLSRKNRRDRIKSPPPVAWVPQVATMTQEQMDAALDQAEAAGRT